MPITEAPVVLNLPYDYHTEFVPDKLAYNPLISLVHSCLIGSEFYRPFSCVETMQQKSFTLPAPYSFPRGSTLQNYSLGHESQAQPSIRNETTPSKEIQRNFFFSMMVFSIPHDLEKSRKNKIWSNFYRHTKTSGNLYFAQKNFLFVLFCSSGLPLARTRWVRSSFSSFCPLSNYQHR